MFGIFGSANANDTMVQVPNGAVPPLSNVNGGPLSDHSVNDDFDSFVVLNRMTANDSEAIENELAASVRSINVGAPTSFSQSGEFLQSSSTTGLPSATNELAGSMRHNFEGGTASLMTSIDNHLSEHTPTTSTALQNGQSFLSSSSGLPSDIQEKMASITQENVQLQVTVDQTNTALNQMIKTLNQWRDDTEKLRQDHKEKFEETRKLVLQLKKDKAEMREHIKQLENQIADLEFRPGEKENELQDTVANLQAKLTIFEATSQSECEKSDSYLKELACLREEVDEYKRKYLELKDQAEIVQEELVKVREENTRLNNDLKNLSSAQQASQQYQTAQTVGFTERVDQLTAKLLDTEQQLQTAQSQLSQHAGPPTSKEQALCVANATVDRLRERVDEMTVSIVTLEEKCETQASEISSLQRDKCSQNEAIGILQAQVQVYQSDFIAERDCRQRLAGEKEQLAEDLRRLHRRNLELEEQLRGRDTIGAPENLRENRNEEQARKDVQESEQNNTFRCPICSTITVRTLQLLNEHMDHCLGSDGI